MRGGACECARGARAAARSPASSARCRSDRLTRSRDTRASPRPEHVDAQLPQVRIPASAGTRRARPAARRRRRRRRSGRPDRGDRPRAARHSGARARRRRHGEHGVARDLLFEADARDPRPAGLRRADRGQGRGLEGRQGLPGQRARVPVRPAAGSRASPPRVRQPAAVPFRGSARAARERAARARAALAAPRDERHVHGGPRVARRRDRGRRLRARRATGSSSATARAARSATCSGSTSRDRCSATAS